MMVMGLNIYEKKLHCLFVNSFAKHTHTYTYIYVLFVFYLYFNGQCLFPFQLQVPLQNVKKV